MKLPIILLALRLVLGQLFLSENILNTPLKSVFDKDPGSFKYLSPGCIDDLAGFFQNPISNLTLRKYLSNTGKGLNELGDYKGCKRIGGNFMTFNLEVPLPVMAIGMCLPDRCRPDDFLKIRELIQDIVNGMGGILGREARLDQITVREITPENKEISRIVPGTIAIYIMLFGSILFGIIISILDKYYPSENPSKGFRGTLSCFNLVKNTYGLFFEKNKVDPNLDIFNGARFFLMMWIIIGHSFVQLIMSAPVNNLVGFMEQVKTRWGLAYFTGALYSVDIFFCLSGFFATFTCNAIFSRPNVKFVPTFISILIQRYIRLFPIYLITYLIFMYFFPTLYDGPIFNRLIILQMGCKDRWYGNFLYFHNFFDAEEMCMPWTWYISDDFQLFLVVPFLSYIYCKSKKWGIISVFLLTIISIGLQIWIFISENLSVYFLDVSYKTYTEKYYYIPYCRCLPYFLCILSYWMYQSYKSTDNKYKPFDCISNALKDCYPLRYILYLIGFILCALCVYFYPNFYLVKYMPPNITLSALFMTFSHLAFTIGFLMIFYPGCLGKARILRAFMGFEIFAPLAKVTYCTYMLHMAMYYLYVSMMEDTLHFSIYKMTMISVDILCVAYIVAIPLSLLFESPLVKVSKFYLRRKKT